ncbi:hypothetical protein [Roseateles violae]|uniref:Uncharacterized protein n=1 Tax=Roseateles violae TaxID=3058042 RepID=A0ABT8DWW7_9BURK|nr:hypothetical protein [Pelomonas sp. PFR6]MDN3921499.1 hypothetical protein [Pelomonas sp. PFR6]
MKGNEHEQEETHPAAQGKRPVPQAQEVMPPLVKKIGIEAAVVIGGALLAALVMRNLPGVRAWVKDAWN